MVHDRFTESNKQLARDETEHGHFVFGISFKHGVWHWSLFFPIRAVDHFG